MRWLVFFVFALTGCTSSKYATPWLRMSSYKPFELMAESGGGARGGWSRVEHVVNGRWEEIPRVGTSALVFDDAKVALIESKLYFENGSSKPIDCPGEVRGRGDRIVCMSAPYTPAQTPVAVILQTYDARGNGTTRTVPAPSMLVMPRKPIDGPDVDYSMLGFQGDGIVFSVFTTRLTDSFANGARHTADAWLLHPNDSWTRVGTLHFETGELWMLHRAEPWNDQNHLRIDEGIMIETLDGSRVYR
jgi:hypothetical protein